MSEYVDKNGVLEKFNNFENIIIELGPGTCKMFPNSISLDRVDLDGVDIVTDFSKGFKFIPDNSVDLIFSRHVLEHVPDLGLILSEFDRVLKVGGKSQIIVPHFSNPYFYSDYTHRSFWGLYTICYFSKDRFFKRTTPTFYQNIHFKINKIDLVFSSPFFFRNKIKKFFGIFFNSCKYLQEFYEENLSNIFPCYELRIEIEKVSK